MYETIFERKPDAKGLAAWVAVLDNGCTRKKVLSGFLNSREMQNLCDELQITQGSYLSDEIVDENPSVTAFVMRLYRCCFDRDGDKKGLAAWTGALLEGRATGAQVAEGFFLSREMANRELSDEQFVIYAYLALLDRQPDARGLAAWTGVLEDGRPRRDIVTGFAQSREFTALCEKYGIERG